MDGDTRNPWVGISILLFMVSVCLVVALLSMRQPTQQRPAWSSTPTWGGRTLREMQADQEREEMQWRVRQIHALQAQEASERAYSRLRR